MRSSLVVSAMLMAISACAGGAPQGQGDGRQGQSAGQWRDMSLATPIGGGDYQRHMRARESAARGGIPYSVPPEHRGREQPEPRAQQRAESSRPGAPLSAPLRARATTTSTAPEPARANRPASEGRRETTVADQQRYDPDTPAATGTGRRAPGQGDSGPVPLVRVTDVSVDDGPNIVAYALRTNHPVGTERYSRRNPLRWQIWERNCLRYSDQNAAQEAFLEAGGPERDRHNLDPVGDGYACWWDPEPIRQAVRGG